MIKHKNRIPLLLICFLFAFYANRVMAQEEIRMPRLLDSEESRRGKFYLVPEMGFWFGTYTNVEAAPQLGFHITDRWSVGTGPHYIFYQNNSFYSARNFSTHIWGIKAFSRLSIIRNAAEILPFYLFDELFAHVEYERMSLENQYFNTPTSPDDGRFWSEYFYVGLGISQRIGAASAYSILLLWNLNDNIYSLYRNPTYRIGLYIYF
jgi:hypothetical protein